MLKTSEKIKKALPYIIVNLAGALISLLSLFTEFGFIPFNIFYGAANIAENIGESIFIIIIIINILSLNVVLLNISFVGLILSILCGSFGAFVGTLMNRNFKYAKIVRIVFNIHIWICVCFFCSICYAVSCF